MTNTYEDGVLVGWYGTTRNANGENVKVFIPRRDEDVEADRIALDPEHPANWQ